MSTHYNYIITGSGCSGLSLLYRMMQHDFFNDKKILVIDQSQKNRNDRTWCFWEQCPGLFEEIVYHRWGQIDFYSNDYSARFDLLPYEYKMIRSIDFYNYVLNLAKQKSNIHFLDKVVHSLTNNNDKAVVTVDDKVVTADYIFNSIIFNQSIEHPPSGERGGYYLLQHFKGWLIETTNNIFDERIASFMDFRVCQKHGTAFVYVLPVASGKALIEYTLFTERLLQSHEYDEALKQYINGYLKLDNYVITEEESGVIPMTSFPFSKGTGKIVNIGTAGGQTKPSSGFTFQFIQKQAAAIIHALVNHKDPCISGSFLQKRFDVYDNTLLNILYHKKLGADKIFGDLFSKNPPQRVLKFLDNETTLREEIKIMNSVSLKVFLPAAIKEFLS